MPFIAIALLIAAALGGGTALAAQQSLPGDPLWGFKVHVNEGVQGALSTSHQSKADWDIAAIQSRLAEAQTLEAQGKLDAQTQSDIAANFNEHAQGAEDAISKLEAAGNAAAAADAAARFQAAVAQFVSLNAGMDAGGAPAASTALGETARGVLDVASKLSAQTSAEAATGDSQKSGNESTSAAANLGANATVDADGHLVK
jgi:hypothetical protein